MRFAVIATAAAAVIAVPLAVQAAGPQMSDDQFIGAVRCAAYSAALEPGEPELGAVRMRLNGEASRQPAETAQRAHNEVNAINRQAATVANAGDAAMMRVERAAACSNASIVAGAPAQHGA